ncbi:putative translation initiation factor IF-2 [Trichuris suis]|nr:putative translation initiation factor IF-2 [Trichuris suis]
MTLRSIRALRLAQTTGFVALCFLVIITGISFGDYAETYLSFGLYASKLAEDLSIERDAVTVRFVNSFNYTFTFYMLVLLFTLLAAIALAVEVRPLLYFTAIIAFVLAINSVVLFSFPALAKSKVDKLTNTILDRGVKSYFTDLHSHDAFLLRSFVDDFQTAYSCCGYNGSNDYEISMASAQAPKYLPCVEQGGKKLGPASVPLTCCLKDNFSLPRNKLDLQCTIGVKESSKFRSICPQTVKGHEFDHEPCKKMVPLINSCITRYSALIEHFHDMIKRVLRSSLSAYVRLARASCLEEWNFRGVCSTHVLQRRKIEKRDPKVFDKKSSKPLVKVWLGITIAELASAMHVHYDDIFECIMRTEYVDLFESTNDKVDDPLLLAQIARMLGFRCEMIKKPGIERKKPMDTEPEIEEMLRRRNVDEKLLRKRHPVVTIMGHVDHGKTTLLDALRHSNITDQEFGAITQHISAFLGEQISIALPYCSLQCSAIADHILMCTRVECLVRLDDGRVITFLDTPGHAVFSKMRSRGAHVTDIVVLVVAGDEGVMEQTIESIRMAKEARASIIVAINKCDKFGVDTVGTLGNTNLQTLCEAIVTQGEIMNLRADFDGLFEGVILESKVSSGKGKVCVALVQRGKLRKGLYLVAGGAWCKVRSIFDENGKSLAEAVPSMPAEVLGWRGDVLPSPGDDVIEVKTEVTFYLLIIHYCISMDSERGKTSNQHLATKRHTRESRQRTIVFYQQAIEERRAVERAAICRNFLTLQPYIICYTADVDGSLEAILDVYQTYNSTKCKFDLVHSGVGEVAENDIEIAELFNAIVYCFNVSVDVKAQERADKNNVEIRHHNVIYKLVEDFKQELSSRLPLVQEELVVGAAEVVKEFLVSDIGKKKSPVAGCEVTKGIISKRDYVRVLRGDEVLYEGEIVSMRRDKDVVSSASAGQEMGIRIADPSVRFNPGDCIICYRNEDKKQEIDWTPPGF